MIDRDQLNPVDLKEMDKIYRLYNKVKRKIENAYRRREEIQNERKYLESIENFSRKSGEFRKFKRDRRGTDKAWLH